MRVGDVDFWEDPAVSSYLSLNVRDWDWSQSPAAWVQHPHKVPQASKTFKSYFDYPLSRKRQTQGIEYSGC